MLARFLARAAEILGRAPAPLALVAPPRAPFPFVALADSLSGLIAREARELEHLEAIEGVTLQQGRTQGLEWPILDLRRTLAAAREAEALLRALVPHEGAVRVMAEIRESHRVWLEIADELEQPTDEELGQSAPRPAHTNANQVALGRAHDAWLTPDRVPVHVYGEAAPVRLHTWAGRLPR